MHTSIAQTSTATSRLPEQSVTASLTVETMGVAGGDSTGSLDRLAEAMPAVVDRAMREAIPHRYSPELARQMADDIMARLRSARAPRPLTGAERGADWMARWDCTPWCVIDHAEKHAPEWHATAPVETDLRDADLESSGVDHDLPWMAARVAVVNDKSQAYGRTTEVMLDYGVHTAQLTPALARKALTALRGFAAELEAVVDQADAVAADDFEGDPEVAAADQAYWDQRIKKINEAQA